MADTRSRILSVTWELLNQRDLRDLTLADVARAAGVSRQAVYLHVENRAGLLIAMARFRDEQTQFAERAREAADLPAPGNVIELGRRWLVYLPKLEPVANALYAAMLAGDVDAGNAWRDRMSDLRRVFRYALRRAEVAGHLRAGLDLETAADWMWMRLHLTAYLQLTEERGWKPAQAQRELLASVERDLLVPSAGTSKEQPVSSTVSPKHRARRRS